MNKFGTLSDWEACLDKLATLQMEMRMPSYISSKHNRLLTTIITDSTKSFNNHKILDEVKRNQTKYS